MLSPQGIYLHGHVGSGKSMLMDMFFESITTTSQSTQQLLHGATNASAGHEQIVAVRTHFQPFMIELLDTLHNWRREDTLASVSDEHERARWEEALNNSTAVLTRAAAKSIAGRCRLMCFDEVQIPDPCSAALVHSLFSSLLQYGVVLVATSNRPPHELDGGGFRGASFTPFVNMLVDHCDVLNLSKRPSKQMQHHAMEQVSHDGGVTGVAESTGSGAVDKCVMSEHEKEDADEEGEEEEEEELPCFDYRLSNAEAANVASSPPFFLYPGSDHVSDTTGMSLHMDDLWSRALAAAALEQEELSAKIDAQNEECGDGASVPVSPPPPPPPLKVYGREISGQVASECGSIARFDFDILCGDARPLGPADYNAIARRYHTVFVDDVPAFHMFNRHLARRLIWFVDALYESRANLVASAAAAPLQLFQPTATSQSEAADVMALESLGSLSETATGRFALADAPPQFLSAPKAPSTFRPEQLELFTGAEDVFAFERCVSRLMEMQTPTYRSQQHRPTLSLNSVSGSPAGFGSMPGAPPPLPVEEEDEDEDEDEHGLFSDPDFASYGSYAFAFLAHK